MTNQSKYNPEYQAIIFNTILKALETHPRLTMIRCDLRFPLETTDAENDSGVITRFIASLKAKIKADLKRKGKGWGRNLICNIQQQIAAVVKYAEYLAKNVTKRYGDGERSIGSSL